MSYLLVLSKLHSLCTGIKLQGADGKGFLQQCGALLELMTALLPSLASPQGIEELLGLSGKDGMSTSVFSLIFLSVLDDDCI